MSAKEVIKATSTDHPRQFEVKNNFTELVGEFDETYVNFAGYFGKHGPHVFAAAPDLLAALTNLLEFEPRQQDEDESDAYKKARAAIAKAKGESK